MPKMINWKKGMRLSDDIFRTADAFTATQIGHAMVLAAAGRFGLFPCTRPFQVNVNISNDFIEVESLECLGLTRDGQMIEAHWDSHFTSNFDTRVPLPKGGNSQDCLLVIQAPNNEYRETSDGYCEPAYKLALIDSDKALPGNALPVARLVFNSYAWQLDDNDFVPPCLFVSSHPLFEQQRVQFIQLLDALEANAVAHLGTVGHGVIMSLLPQVRALRIVADKQRDTLTPMELLGLVQQCVSAFVTGCEMDRMINLNDIEEWKNYVKAPYSVRHVRQLIQQGLSLCAAINEKINNFGSVMPEPAPRPVPPMPREERMAPPPVENKKILTIP
ncbi:MAG: hypothetical protein J6S96_09260 [Muribaculaceae bacterium]|nr:hypothetical protein [Muribaculaceae bacterium]